MKVVETATGMLYEWNSTNTFLTVSMLHPYYVYDISVAAVTIGIGPFSDDIKVITDEAGESIIRIHLSFPAFVTSLSSNWSTTKHYSYCQISICDSSPLVPSPVE